ncbi:MAG TPA: sigma-54 dependent transcriptional regulator [Desulfosalsimonadaceae bacterium]|nr:sigma-54 dependent transcriptional regulator [Desulfosalsimonadaceae bacterium]
MNENSATRILVVDDEANMRHMLQSLLGESGYVVDTASEGGQALEMLEGSSYGFVFCDIRMPGMDGMAFLKSAGRYLEHTNVIMMSAYGTIDTAVEAMKCGAYDYISKPFKPDEILLTLRKAEERQRLQTENSRLREQVRAIENKDNFGEMIGSSKAMQDVFKLAAKVAHFETTVLISGESGTGKELMARGIHNNSQRQPNRLIPVNCGGIPETLLESELFGYKKGAFTGADKDSKGLFEAASGGTIFLDEVGDLPLSLQVKLLRILQDNQVRPVGDTRSRQVDVRIIAATSKDLGAEVTAGRFREDLFYRLHVMPIRLPSLIERTEDIPLLCQHFIERYSQKFNKPVDTISPAAMTLLFQHHWPGNVRELENIIERAVVLSEGDVIDADLLPPQLGEQTGSSRIEEVFRGYSLKSAKAVLEQNLIQRALEATEGNRSRAAKLLEISHPSLLQKIKTYNINE